MIGNGLRRRDKGALIGVAGFACLLTVQMADRPPANAGRQGAAPTLALDLTLDLGAAAAALRLRL